MRAAVLQKTSSRAEGSRFARAAIRLKAFQRLPYEHETLSTGKFDSNMLRPGPKASSAKRSQGAHASASSAEEGEGRSWSSKPKP